MDCPSPLTIGLWLSSIPPTMITFVVLLNRFRYAILVTPFKSFVS